MIHYAKIMNCDYTLGIACGFRRLQLILVFRDEIICFTTMLVKTTAQNIDKNTTTVKIVLKTGLVIELIRLINTFDRVFLNLLPTNSKSVDYVSLLWKTKLVLGRWKKQRRTMPYIA